jgi:predicted ATP-grasp superfamily ATP-dependent carboligase
MNERSGHDRAATGVVVLGGYVNALGVVRALVASGWPVAVITSKPFDIAHRSRHVVAHAAAPWLDDEPGRLVELLLQRCRSWEGWVLLPTNDGALSALSQHRATLSRHYRVAAPPWAVARQLLDKQLMGEAAMAAGLRIPRDLGPATTGCWERAGLEFPLLVKPQQGHLFFARFHRKLFRVEDREELRRAVELVDAAGLNCRLHEWIPGPDEQIYSHTVYVNREGVASPGVSVRKRRQSPAVFGVARVATIVPDPPGLAEATLALVRQLGLCGPATAEFKLDPRDGQFRFMEINGRMVLFNTLLKKGGLDLAALAVADQLGIPIAPVVPNPWDGHWVNLHADLLHSLLEMRRRSISLSAVLQPYRGRWAEAVWAADDPVPFLLQWGRTAGEAGRALLRGRLGALLSSSGP